MTEVLTSAQMRAIEAAAIASGAVTGLELMERAGRGVVAAAFAEWPELAKAGAARRALVLCGPGNNGGDGFVVARLLHEEGWAVTLTLLGDAGRLPPDALRNCERWRGMGEVLAWDERAVAGRLADFVDGRPETFAQDLVIDAHFGIGMSRAMPEETALVRREISTCRARAPVALRPKFLAIDVPSGLSTDTGADFGAFPADLTVTFHRPKLGHYLVGDAETAGAGEVSDRLRVVDIGLPQVPVPGSVATVEVAPERLAKSISGQKYGYGHALVLSGSSGRGGAARLAARGALRIGAGLVTLGCPGEALAENAAQLNAVMLREVEDGAALARLLQDRRINALCLGPGMGVDARGAGLVAAALGAVGGQSGRHGRKIVLDADALTLIARDRALFGMLHPGCVLTPHGGEFARLFPDIAATLAAPGAAWSKVDATREAAERAGCVVLFKGPDTVIADPSGACQIHAAVRERAAPWLATAGSGDVLAGYIAGLLARGFAPIEAAATAAWLHAECARSFGPGLVAEDLPAELPKVFRSLGI